MKSRLKNLSSLISHLSSRRGFTLIELLIVITIIAALAVTVFVALNPAKRLADARDARRTSDVDSILTAVHQSIVDNKGDLPTNLEALAIGTVAQIGTPAVGCATYGTDACGTQAACVNLMSGANNLSAYLQSMPVDPLASDALETGYSVVRDANGIITIGSCAAENAVISASR